jgi:arylsulfatase A-like enzyme
MPPLEGVSLLPLFWKYNDDAAVRVGDWKLTRFDKSPWELYDLSHDRSEQRNLIATEPARAKELAALWDA